MAQFGPNHALVGQPAYILERDLATPALVLDLDTLEANLKAMALLVRSKGRRLRPHAKAHKSKHIAQLQIAAGAVGLCCATVLEAEQMADAGVESILVTTQVVSPRMLERLSRVAANIKELLVVVDSLAGIERLAEQAEPDRPIGVLIDIDMGAGRTGLRDASEAVQLARRIAELPQLVYRGVQAYYGHLQHVQKLSDRRDSVAVQWQRLSQVIVALRLGGFDPEIISGGGTGTHHLDLDAGPFTEIQPGSYLFLDKQYGEVEIDPQSTFGVSLKLASRVISDAQHDHVVVDAGSKALSTDYGPALISDGAPVGTTFRFMGDEHGGIQGPPGTPLPRVGDLVYLVPPHCDPTVNLHDRLHVVRNGILVDIWPIDARGH